MLTFDVTLEPATLHTLTTQLSRLAGEVSYQPGKLSIDKFRPADEPRIVDIVASLTKATSFQEPEEPYIDWLELTRQASRKQRTAAAQDKEAWARLRAKRQRQSGAMVIGP